MVNSEIKGKIIESTCLALIEKGIIVWTGARFGLVTGFCVQQLAIGALSWLLDLLFHGLDRIRAAIRERDQNNSIISVIMNEIGNMALESFKDIYECLMAVISLIKYLVEEAKNRCASFASRGAQFSGNMQNKALTFTSYSSSRR